ncbi:MAG: histidine phosphatase family protein [Proteobacteria bacterium]|nr:histidine phosphatase family protein [Pseudomonadota bacterium]
MLLRHGKSSWNIPGSSDFERPLNKRGRDASKVMGSYILENAETPALILCSGARRARETLEFSGLAEQEGVSVLIEDGLYLAPTEQLADRISEVADKIDSVLMIGHNPGMGEFAQYLGALGEPSDIQRLQGNFPTCALAVFQMDITTWSTLPGPHIRMISLVFPRELGDISA